MKIYQFLDGKGEPIVRVTAENHDTAIKQANCNYPKEVITYQTDFYSYEENSDWDELPEREQELRFDNSFQD